MAYNLLIQKEQGFLVKEEIGLTFEDLVARGDAWDVEHPLMMWAYDLPTGCEIVGEVLDEHGYTLGTMGGRDDWFTVFVPETVPDEWMRLVTLGVEDSAIALDHEGAAYVAPALRDSARGFVFRVRYGGDVDGYVGFEEGRIVRVSGDYETTAVSFDGRPVYV